MADVRTAPGFRWNARLTRVGQDFYLKNYKAVCLLYAELDEDVEIEDLADDDIRIFPDDHEQLFDLLAAYVEFTILVVVV